MPSKNGIIKKVTDEYISEVDVKSKKPEDIEEELLERIANSIDEINAVLDKSRKISVPKCLPSFCVKKLFLSKYEVRRIHYGYNLNDNNYDLIVYDEVDGIYKADDKEIRQIIKRFNSSMSESEYKTLIKDLEAVATPVYENNDPNLIPCNNGVFNVETKQLMPFSPKYIFISKIHTDYNPNATNVTIHDGNDQWDVESWFKSLSDDPEIVSLLWYVINMMIRNKVAFNKAICLYSPSGNNGKGTLCTLIENLFGIESCISLDFQAFSKEFGLEGLEKASAAITHEISSDIIKNAANLKSLITHDAITVNRKFKSVITVRKSISYLFCVNNLPRFADKSQSLYRRFLFIPFNRCFSGAENKKIKSDYINRKEVLEYVLHRALSLPAITELPECEACKKVLAELMLANDSSRAFIDEMLPQLHWRLLPYQFLYDLYRAWFAENCPSGKPVSSRTFNENTRQILANSTEYKCCDTAVPTRNLMDGPELFIARYNLTHWMNPVYTGGDMNTKCTPLLKSSYTGVMKLN